MAKSEYPDSGRHTTTESALQNLAYRALFTLDDFKAMAKAAGQPLTRGFLRVMHSAAVQYLGWRNHRPQWTPALVRKKLKAVANTARRLTGQLSRLSAGARVQIDYGAWETIRADLRESRIRQPDSAVARYEVPVTSAHQPSEHLIDYTPFLLNPSAVYPIEFLQRAVEVAARGEVARMRVDPLGFTVAFLAQQLDLPLTVTVGAVDGRVTGRLADLVVILTRALSKADFPDLGLPDARVEVGADGARKAIERAKRRSRIRATTLGSKDPRRRRRSAG